MKLCWTFFFLFVATQAYREGDIVRGWQKTQTSEWASTEWTEILGKYCPKYTYRRTVPLPITRADQSIPEGNVKMSFAFDELKFITPYILVYSDNKILEFVEFTFIYSGDDIINFKYKTHYSDEDEYEEGKKRKNTISLKYEFEESTEMDISLGMGIFLFIGFGMSILLLFTVLIDLLWKSQEYVDKKKAERKMEAKRMKEMNAKQNEKEDVATSSPRTHVDYTSQSVDNTEPYTSVSSKGKDD